jgi:hypothetical protein
MLAHIVDNFARSREQPFIVKDWLTHGDAIPTKLSGLTQQPRRMSQRPDWDRPVIGRHSADIAERHKSRLGAQLSGAECSSQTGRTSANDDDIHETLARLNPDQWQCQRPK